MNKNKRMLIIWLVLATAVFVGVIAFERVVVPSAVISDEAKTLKTMSLIEKSIFAYVASKGRLPRSLDEVDLGLLPDSTLDAWGRPIQYDADANGVVVLKSFGREKGSRTGRTGSGLEYFFETKSAGGKWLNDAPLFPRSKQRAQEGSVNMHARRVSQQVLTIEGPAGDVGEGNFVSQHFLTSVFCRSQDAFHAALRSP